MSIGRAPEGAIVVSDRSVSRRHAVIRHRNGDLILEDAGSSMGTFVNDQAVRPGEPLVLQDGDVIRFGQVQMVCRFDPEVIDTGEATRDAAFASQANARILLLEGENVRRQPLAGPVSLIGSAPHCEVRLQDRTGPPEQALIRAVGGEFRIEPRSAAMPPRLNEAQAPVLKPMRLVSNSVLLLHRAQALFLYDFGEDGLPLADPLRGNSRRKLLRHVAAQSGHSARALGRLCRDRDALGQTLGEILVERGLVTPITWRVFCTRLLSEEVKKARFWRWGGRRGVR